MSDGEPQFLGGVALDEATVSAARVLLTRLPHTVVERQALFSVAATNALTAFSNGMGYSNDPGTCLNSPMELYLLADAVAALAAALIERDTPQTVPGTYQRGWALRCAVDAGILPAAIVGLVKGEVADEPRH